jgi:hypothetical protein
MSINFRKKMNMRSILFGLFSSLFLAGASPASDLIIDRKGNEIVCKVISVDARHIAFERDSAGTTQQTQVKASDVFMIKYGSGEKKVFSAASISLPAPPISDSRLSCTILADMGIFGLFNVDNEFTKSNYSTGFTPLLEYRLNQTFSVGVECLTLWGKPQTNDNPRLLIDPSIRAKALFAVTTRLCINPVIGIGASIWPKSGGSAYLDSTFLNLRLGWNARAALCFDYRMTNHIALAFEIGYSASSSESDGVWITHDMMLVGVGPRISF